jgi:uncharacterized iron-regulated membrane protein
VLRKIVLKTHLYLGLAAAVFLVILGLTGSVMAFEGDIDRWLHPGIWYVKTGPRTLPEQELIRMAQERFAPVRVRAVHVFREPDVAQVMQMSDGARVFINPYDGTILGRRKGPTRTERLLGQIHQLHLRLTPDPRSMQSVAKIGEPVISFAGLILCVMVPTGLLLWWRTRRASIKWKGSWFRICFDAHHMIGIYAALFLFIAAFTGVLIGFDFGEEAIYAITRSTRPHFAPPPPSDAAAPGATVITADQAAEIARRTMPNTTVSDFQLPLNAKGSYSIAMRAPEETSEAVHSFITIDQYSSKVLRFQNFLTDSYGYRAIRFNRSIHTGDVWGLTGHIIVSLSSLLLVAMVITGVVIWWKKLAV